MVLEPWRDLRGTIVMVTGASSGIGWNFCIDLAKAGCKIIAAARRTERLKTLCENINSSELKANDDQVNENNSTNNDVVAVAVELDISVDGHMIEASVQKAWEVFGRIDALINNAGLTGPTRSSVEFIEEDWGKILKTNLRGSWLVSKYVCRLMVASNQEGSIINISSIAGIDRTIPYGPVAYACSKSAILTMTKVMALELGEHKIRVNAISPGLFKSEITEQLYHKKGLQTAVSRGIPLREFGTTDPALTSLVRFLIHSSSNYVTGNNFIVDAGTTLPGVPIYSSI